MEKEVIENLYNKLKGICTNRMINNLSAGA